MRFEALELAIELIRQLRPIVAKLRTRDPDLALSSLTGSSPIFYNHRRSSRRNSDADRRTLVRRLYFDVTGLPPDPARVEALVSDRSPDAYDRGDRVKCSPSSRSCPS